MKWLAVATALCAVLTPSASRAGPLAPIPPAEAVSTHGPYEMGACVACHREVAGQKKPGPVIKMTNDLCYDCHDEFKGSVKNHPGGKASCLSCHSPHNARKRMLLL
jgi:predicted CXXCH cytochrome family protein